MIALCTISAHAMKRPRSIELEESSSKKPTINNKIDNSDAFSFIVKNKILPLSTIIEAHRKYPQAIRTLNRLSLTNKALNAILNNQKDMFDCIKQISERFGHSHQRTARDLRIKMANEIHDWQELFYAGVSEALSSPHFSLRPLNRLVKMGIDINFTYYRDQETILAIALRNPYRNTMKKRIIDWLIENGTDTITINNSNHCATAIALQENDVIHAKKFFAHSQFNPHHVDTDGNTLLHHFIATLQRNKYRGTIGQKTTYDIRQLIERLLAMGIDISIANTKGCTALMMATKLRDAPTINLLEKYALSQLQGNQGQQA